MIVVIIEDEPLAADRLRLLLRQYDPRILVSAIHESVADTVAWLRKTENSADLLLADIHLSDGSVFDIFKQVDPAIPVILTTAYHDYAIDAFKLLSIDYLVKPITLESLARAIGKFHQLRSGNDTRSIDYNKLALLAGRPLPAYKSRFLGRIGQKQFLIYLKDVALFVAEKRTVYLITLDNSKYVVDHTLDELETELDSISAFRINRSVIVHAAAIDEVKPYVNARLRLVLKNKIAYEQIIVSRERVAAFRKWIDS